MADLGNLGSDATKQFIDQIRIKGGVDVETITADATIDKGTSNFCRINGGASNRNIDFEDVVADTNGLVMLICNSGTTNNLVIRDAAAATIVTLRPGEAAVIGSSGSVYVVLAHFHDVPTVIPVSLMYGEATPLDQSFFVATAAYRVVAITGRPLVVGSDGGSVVAVVKKAPSGTAIASGTALHSGNFDMKGTVNTNQSLTLSTTATDLDIAAGDAIGIDTTGTMTAARGCVTVALIPA